MKVIILCNGLTFDVGSLACCICASYTIFLVHVLRSKNPSRLISSSFSVPVSPPRPFKIHLTFCNILLISRHCALIPSLTNNVWPLSRLTFRGLLNLYFHTSLALLVPRVMTTGLDLCPLYSKLPRRRLLRQYPLRALSYLLLKDRHDLVAHKPRDQLPTHQLPNRLLKHNNGQGR